jgi:hypothetical protein
MQDFKKLIVWRNAHELTLGVYNATKGFLPKRPLACEVNCAEHPRPSASTSLKDAAVAARLSCADTFEWRKDLQASLNTNFYWRVT